MNFLWAANSAVIAGNAEPRRIALEDFFTHIRPNHGKDLSRCVVHICARRAGTTAGTALYAHIQSGFSRRRFHDFVDKTGPGWQGFCGGFSGI